MTDTDSTKTESSPEGQCHFFVVRKKRLCRMTVRPGKNYCGEHEPRPSAADQLADIRIPCPYDPKHTCYASKMERHLTICNARQVETPPYIVRGVNAPAAATEMPERRPLANTPPETIAKVIAKVNKLFERHLSGRIPPPRPAPLPAAMASEAAARGARSRRHLRQAAALLALAEGAGLVQDETCYVELGAGKGHLSYYACVLWCGAASRSRVLLVDRAALRHKRDNKLRPHASGDGTSGTEATLTAESVVRVRADLADLSLAGTAAARASKAMVGLAKHLCGVATDYALRCITGMDEAVAPSEPSESPEYGRARARGLALAACCHHRCEAAAYVGMPYLEELGITPEELNVMLGIVSWATCGDGRSRDRRAMDPTLSDNMAGDHEMETESEKIVVKLESSGNDHASGDRSTKNLDIDAEEYQTSRERSPKRQKANQQSRKPVDSDNERSPEARQKSEQHSTHHNHTNTEVTDQMVINAGETSSPDSETSSDLRVSSRIESGNNQSSDNNNARPPESLDIKARETVGRRAKALIDYGRVLYLRARGFNANLVYFVPQTDTPENLCIVANRKCVEKGE